MREAELARFSRRVEFHRALSKAVHEHFRKSEDGNANSAAAYLKSAIIAGAAILCYVAYLLLPMSLPTVIALAVLFGFVLAGIGFNVHHDGGHRSFSRWRVINRLAAFSLDLLGGSSYIWRWKHNVFHHTFPNVDGADPDIDFPSIARFAPAQTRRAVHRYQHYYLWLLYPLVPIRWHFFNDFHVLLTGRSGKHRVPRPRGSEVAILIAGKVIFFMLAFGLPATLLPWPTVLLFYAVSSLTLGCILTVVFQLGHCVIGTSFVTTAETIEEEWAIHQMRTTADFAPRSPTLTWYLGGLNFQVEHHLFPGVPHVHYPALAPIVERIARQHGVPYMSHATLWQAIQSHYRLLKLRGRSDGQLSEERVPAREQIARGV